jgi:hypothetical protein
MDPDVQRDCMHGNARASAKVGWSGPNGQNKDPTRIILSQQRADGRAGSSLDRGVDTAFERPIQHEHLRVGKGQDLGHD